MSAAVWLLAALVCADTSRREAPAYSAESIVNAASNVPGFLAPNTFVSIYGTDLAFVTKAITPEDLRGGILPTVLAGTGVRVLINRQPANIWYVSPVQINLLIPPGITPGRAEIQVILDGRQGPAVTIDLDETGPAFFQIDSRTLLAAHANGSLVTDESPARAGDRVTLYATGLGETSPPAMPNELPQGAASLRDLGMLRVVVNGADLERRYIEYAGVAPGFAGVYQINLVLPEDAGEDPELRIGFGERLSPPGLKLTVE